MHRRNSDDFSDAPSPRDRDYDYSSTTTSSYRDPYYEDDRRGGLFHRRDSRTVAPEHHGPWTASATSVPPVDMPMGMTGNRSGEPGMLRRGMENLKENVGGNRDRSAYRSYSRDSWERENNRKNKDSRRRDVDFMGRDKSHRSDYHNDNETSSSRYGSDFGGMSSGYHGASSYGGSYHPSYYGHGYDLGHSGYGAHDYGMMGHYGSYYGHPSYYNSGSHYGYYPHYSSGMGGHSTGHSTGGHSTGYEGLYFGEIYESRNNAGRGIESLTRGMKSMNVNGRVRPDVDIYGNEQEWIIEMDLPGFVRENIDMKFIGDNLEITATPVQRDSSIKYHVFERSNPTYFRKIHLPAGVDGKRINAVLTNGILRITVPKVDITGTTGLTGTTGTGYSGVTTGNSGLATGASTTTTTTDSI